MAQKSGSAASPARAKKTAKTTVAATAPAIPSPCTPFAIDVAVLTPDDRTKIIFGLSRQCEPVLVWRIHFVLQEIDGAVVTERVKVDVVVGDDKIPRAEAVAAAQQGIPATDPQLEAAKLDLLQTRVTDRASELAPGSTTDEELESLLPRVL